MNIEISVIVPVFNSKDSLEELAARLKRVLSEYSEYFEIILVDDFSKDSSYQIMTALHEHDERIKAIRLKSNYGQNNATFCGLVYARGRYIVTLDDDLQHPPEEIPLLVDKIKEGYDAVFGVPVIKRHARYRNWGSMLVNYCLTAVTHKPLDLRVSSFRALSRRMVDAIRSEPHTFIYLAVPILRNSMQVISIPVKHDSRKHGKSNYNLKNSAILVMKLLVHYSFIPVKLFILLWLFFVWTLTNNIYSGKSLSAIISMIGGGLTLFSVIIAVVYLRSIRKEPPFLIAEIRL